MPCHPMERKPATERVNVKDTALPLGQEGVQRSTGPLYSRRRRSPADFVGGVHPMAWGPRAAQDGYEGRPT